MENLAWTDATRANTDIGYLNYLELCPFSLHLLEIVAYFEKKTTRTDNYCIEQFASLVNEVNTKTYTTVSSCGLNNHTHLIFGGMFPVPIDKNLRSWSHLNVWGPGARHILKGSLNILDFKFLSNPDDRLEFDVTIKGYNYRSGSGIVVITTGTVIYFGK